MLSGIGHKVGDTVKFDVVNFGRTIKCTGTIIAAAGNGLWHIQDGSIIYLYASIS